MGEIILSDALEKIKEEIQLLKMTLAECLQRRDELIYHICPDLRARYAREIGDYQNRANYQELLILELKRRIEITQAALNREKSISEEEVEQQVKREYREFHQRVEEEYQKSRKFQEEQAKKEEKRKHYEDQWKSRYHKDGDQDRQRTDAGENGSAENPGNAGGDYFALWDPDRNIVPIH